MALSIPETVLHKRPFSRGGTGHVMAPVISSTKWLFKS